MSKRVTGAIILSLAFASGAMAKKKEQVVPEYILRAHTIAVMIDPAAGMSADDPRANQVAQKDVEAALVKWGRFTPVISAKGADIVIVIRKGNNRAVDDTIGGPTQSDRGGVMSRPNNGVQPGAPHGGLSDGMGGASTPMGGVRPQASPQLEAGTTDDSFVVHHGDALDPVDSPIGWRYVAKDGLRAHDVPAVEEFKKALVAADKAAAAAAAGKQP